jgi:hypothetical protein
MITCRNAVEDVRKRFFGAIVSSENVEIIVVQYESVIYKRSGILQ